MPTTPKPSPGGGTGNNSPKKMQGPNAPSSSGSGSSSSSGSSSGSTAGASKVLLALIVESAGLFIAVQVAGFSKDVGNLMLIFMFGILTLFLIMHWTEVNEFANWSLNVERNA